MKWKDRAEKLKIDIPAIYFALKDKETPVTAKIFAAITICYALSPVDLIPDFIPVLGYLDDILLLPLMVMITIKLIPKEIMEKNRRLSEDCWSQGKPEKWYFGIPVVLFWLLLIGWFVKCFICGR